MQNDRTTDDFALSNVDGRTKEARRFKAIMRDLCEQLGHEPSSAEMALLNGAAMFQMMIERDSLLVFQGLATPDERIRRNFTAMRAALTALGLAMKSRDVTKGSIPKGRSVLSQISSATSQP